MTQRVGALHLSMPATTTCCASSFWAVMAAVLSGVRTLLVKALRRTVVFQQKHCCSEQSMADQDCTAVEWVHPNAFVKLVDQIPFGRKLQEALQSRKMLRFRSACTRFIPVQV